MGSLSKKKGFLQLCIFIIITSLEPSQCTARNYFEKLVSLLKMILLVKMKFVLDLLLYPSHPQYKV